MFVKKVQMPGRIITGCGIFDGIANLIPEYLKLIAKDGYQILIAQPNAILPSNDVKIVS